MSASYQILYWRDIPAQIKVRSSSGRINRQLSPRFQEAIDEAAMRADATSTDGYLEEWHSSDWQEGGENAEQLADSIANQLEAEYTPERLRQLKANKGFEAA
jgi:hypothetical protein